MTTANEKRIPYQNRVELLQGTHDMLILQTLQWASSTDTALAERFASDQAKCRKWRQGQCIPRCTG
jgi:hypothetical protein